MTKGIRFIDGQEYLLCGRYFTKEQAQEARKQLLKSWMKARIIKLLDCDWMVYVHGQR